MSKQRGPKQVRVKQRGGRGKRIADVKVTPRPQRSGKTFKGKNR